MKIESFDIEATIEKARALIDQDKQMSAATKSIVEVLILSQRPVKSRVVRRATWAQR